jgi:hypothetical protein
LLKRGDTFPTTDGFNRPGKNNNFGTASNPYYPQVIGSYGTGARPIIQSEFNDWNVLIQNYVLEDLNFVIPQVSGISLLGNTNKALIENCQFDYEVVIQGSPSTGQYMSGITVRRCEFLNCVRSNPYNGPYTTTAWGNDYNDIWNNRLSGIYQNGTVSFLFEENIMDHCGWSAGYDPTGTQIGNPNQPPSEYSHNLYSGSQNFDMTVRNNITTEAASMGFKLASCGDIYGNVIVNNNIGMIVAEDPLGLYGSFLMMHDNLVEEASANASVAGWEGALGWGIDLAQAPPHPNGEIIRNMEVDSTASGSNTSLSTQATWISTNTLLSGTNVVYNYGTTPNLNQTGSSYYDSTRTVESYNASVGGLATLADYLTHIRAQEKETWNPAYAAEPLLNYMQTGFNLALPTRTGTTVTFTAGGLDQVRWDNPRNWSTLDIPGSVTNDTANINGDEVVYDGTYSLSQLELQNGGILDIDKGSLTLIGSASIQTVGTLGGTINLGNSGALSLSNYTTSSSPLTINQDGGLLSVGNNLGSGTNVNVNVYVSGGTAFLGSPGTGSHFGAGSSLNIIGSGANTIGYQTSTGNNYIAFDNGGTLSYKLDTGTNGVTPISEFYGSTVTSVLTINSGATLNIDVTNRTGLAAGNYSTTLAQVDSLSGTFSTVNITGMNSTNKITNPQIVYNYSIGTITLTYTVTP